MTKQQIIDILEAYKPSGNIYNGYNSIEEKVDEKICSLLDEIINSVKREADDDNVWIILSDKTPEPMQQVLFYDIKNIDYAVGIYNKNSIQVGAGSLYTDGKESYTHWRIPPQPPKEESR